MLQKVGQVAYKLDLPPQATIHPVIHVSQLKKQIPAQANIEEDILAIPEDPDEQVSPAILDRKMVITGGSAVTKLKVQWESFTPGLATWEEEQDLNRRFPTSVAWGQAASKGGGTVTTNGQSG